MQTRSTSRKRRTADYRMRKTQLGWIFDSKIAGNLIKDAISVGDWRIKWIIRNLSPGILTVRKGCTRLQTFMQIFRIDWICLITRWQMNRSDCARIYWAGSLAHPVQECNLPRDEWTPSWLAKPRLNRVEKCNPARITWFYATMGTAYAVSLGEANECDGFAE